MHPVNVKASVSKHFIIDDTVKVTLLREHDWNEPKSGFQGKTIAWSEESNKVVYDVFLDEEKSSMFLRHLLQTFKLHFIGVFRTLVSR
ncbi:hypothetical protein CU097_010312 [Rhizopus azygosporus]|uniref:Uncharacterized protein n=1 Tax=Rhizopus azygosporus TaxID=86630 RepID=A0A367JA95_RHIAZ|nr:hypothetical protein CU097_010312 [Rhizopus azygosporus]